MRRNTIVWFLGIFFLIVGGVAILLRNYYFILPKYISYLFVGVGIFLIMAEIITYNSAF